jgi:hypothetical protein
MTSFTLIMFVLPAAIVAAALVLARTAWTRSRGPSGGQDEGDR